MTTLTRASLHPIMDNLGPDKTTLFIGDTDAAADVDRLHRLGIVSVLNCAINLNINYVIPDANQPVLAAHGPSSIRTYKLGLIDGDGNSVGQLIAGYFLLKSAFEQRMPNSPSYPLPSAGHVLIHCRGGRSRSVIVAALYLHRECRAQFSTLAQAIEFIRVRRELHPSEWHETPKPMLIELAQKASEALDAILCSGRLGTHIVN